MLLSLVKQTLVLCMVLLHETDIYCIDLHACFLGSEFLVSIISNIFYWITCLNCNDWETRVTSMQLYLAPIVPCTRLIRCLIFAIQDSEGWPEISIETVRFTCCEGPHFTGNWFLAWFLMMVATRDGYCDMSVSWLVCSGVVADACEELSASPSTP